VWKRYVSLIKETYKRDLYEWKETIKETYEYRKILIKETYLALRMVRVSEELELKCEKGMSVGKRDLCM